MGSWFRSNLGDAMLAGEALDQINALFLAEFEKVNDPRELAVFVRHDSEGRLHCEVNVYLSPAAAMVARAIDAVPCRKPCRYDLGLLCGSEEAWSLFFP